MPARTAFITGITGQDGSYLADLLLSLGYEVHGLVRRSPTERFERLEHLRGKLRLHEGDLLDAASLAGALLAADPDEIYHLAGPSDVAVSWQHPALVAEMTGAAVARMFEAVRAAAPGARVYFASTGEIFGAPTVVPQTETTPVAPVTPYGAAKAHGHFLAGVYRDTHGLHVSRGILYTHESPRRGRRFAGRKITLTAAAIRLGAASRLRLGELDASRDWGFAHDYVRAMWLMLQQDEPGDFVVATGVAHTVRDWVQIAFDHAGLNVDEHVQHDPELLRPREPGPLLGDAAHARATLDWSPEVGFEELVRMMVDADLALLRHELQLRGALPRS